MLSITRHASKTVVPALQLFAIFYTIMGTAEIPYLYDHVSIPKILTDCASRNDVREYQIHFKHAARCIRLRR